MNKIMQNRLSLGAIILVVSSVTSTPATAMRVAQRPAHYPYQQQQQQAYQQQQQQAYQRAQQAYQQQQQAYQWQQAYQQQAYLQQQAQQRQQLRPYQGAVQQNQRAPQNAAQQNQRVNRQAIHPAANQEIANQEETNMAIAIQASLRDEQDRQKRENERIHQETKRKFENEQRIIFLNHKIASAHQEIASYEIIAQLIENQGAANGEESEIINTSIASLRESIAQDTKELSEIQPAAQPAQPKINPTVSAPASKKPAVTQQAAPVQSRKMPAPAQAVARPTTAQAPKKPATTRQAAPVQSRKMPAPAKSVARPTTAQAPKKPATTRQAAPVQSRKMPAPAKSVARPTTAQAPKKPAVTQQAAPVRGQKQGEMSSNARHNLTEKIKIIQGVMGESNKEQYGKMMHIKQIRIASQRDGFSCGAHAIRAAQEFYHYLTQPISNDQLITTLNNRENADAFVKQWTSNRMLLGHQIEHIRDHFSFNGSQISIWDSPDIVGVADVLDLNIDKSKPHVFVINSASQDKHTNAGHWIAIAFDGIDQLIIADSLNNSRVHGNQCVKGVMEFLCS